MRIGDYYNDGRIKGVVIKVDSSGDHGLIWSLQRNSCQWYAGTKDVHTGARHPLDGRINQNIVLFCTTCLITTKKIVRKCGNTEK